MPNGLRWTLTAIAVFVSVVVLSVWFMADEPVARLRASAAKAPPLPPLLAKAILAAEDPELLDRPAAPLQALVPSSAMTRHCGATLTMSVIPTRRRLHTAVATLVVTRVFSSEQLLRVFANEAFMGFTRGKLPVRGMTNASRVYFGKTPEQLTTAEAAMLAGMIRSPNAYSPVRYPERARERRDKILALMHRHGFIDQTELDRALAE